MSDSQNNADRFYRLNYIIVFTVITIMLGIWIFFVSFRMHKNTDGKLEIYLPRDKGMEHTPVGDPILEEIRVSMEWDVGAGKTKLMLGSKPMENLSKLEEIIREVIEDCKKVGKPVSDPVVFYGDMTGSLPVKINAAPNVPWQDVVNVINICKKQKIGILFAYRYISEVERENLPGYGSE